MQGLRCGNAVIGGWQCEGAGGLRHPHERHPGTRLERVVQPVGDATAGDALDAELQISWLGCGVPG